MRLRFYLHVLFGNFATTDIPSQISQCSNYQSNLKVIEYITSCDVLWLTIRLVSRAKL